MGRRHERRYGNEGSAADLGLLRPQAAAYGVGSVWAAVCTGAEAAVEASSATSAEAVVEAPGRSRVRVLCHESDRDPVGGGRGLLTWVVEQTLKGELFLKDQPGTPSPSCASASQDENREHTARNVPDAAARSQLAPRPSGEGTLHVPRSQHCVAWSRRWRTPREKGRRRPRADPRCPQQDVCLPWVWRLQYGVQPERTSRSPCQVSRSYTLSLPLCLSCSCPSRLAAILGFVSAFILLS